MNRLLDAANQFFRESDWKTMAVLKFCLISLGILIGVPLPQSIKSGVLVVCVFVFLVTYIPLMAKLFRILKKQ